ncbi:mammalian cell entry protein [Mycolicibacter nonchromogenicus]|uniref:Mammalian cell entry protein n=1 Tax=Mycolicibacter nonchromogenicus TaxID=1782 RepID=A0A1X1ZD92_MYCNO|nr:MCE family protein [Mycolicibacter nonchromogenicus]ORW21256.1 mammalian cell entry protein [Mycolicibacter nonchromogenicus]
MQQIESAHKPLAGWRLLLRGVAVLAGVVLLAGIAIAKSQGAFADHVRVTALLSDVGDGLPKGSDVKFRGALVGAVTKVTPALGGRPNAAELSIDPHFAPEIPATVTARVVPSNVFAVSSIQLVDNGPGAGLRTGAQITQDQSLATIQFQTVLTKMREVLGAVGRPGSRDSIGVLQAVAEATSGRGDALEAASGGAKRIVGQLNEVMEAPGTESTVEELTDALTGLQAAAPDLLGAVHQMVVPMRTLAEKRLALADFLSAGNATMGSMAEAFENHTDRMIVITTQLSPVLGVLADAGDQFAPMVTRMNNVVNRFFEHVWRSERNTAVGKFMLVITPNRMYTRQDCPRYGDLEGPSCHTAPLTADPPAFPQAIDPRNYPLAPELAAGGQGLVGGPEERAKLTEILGPDTNPASELLLGPVVRGTTVQMVPEPAPPAGPAPSASTSAGGS